MTKLVDLATSRLKMLAVIAAATAIGGTGAAISVTTVADSHATQGLATAAEHANENAQLPTANDPETVTAAAPTTAPTPPPCLGTEKNHGEYVSHVAKTTPHGKGSQHGAIVSQAAKSDCGKDAAGADDEGTEDESTKSPKPTKTHGQSGSHTPDADDSGEDTDTDD
jgi:hypothetical protein